MKPSVAFWAAFCAAGLVISSLPAQPLVMECSTYWGGSGREYARYLSFDSAGRVFLMGYTSSDDFPTLSPYQSSRPGPAGRYDVFVSLFSPSVSALVYSTYVGGSGSEQGYGFALGSDGRAWLSGYTDSRDFPTVNPFQAAFAGGTDDGFVACLSSTGSALLSSTYLGGGAFDGMVDLALDPQGRVHLTGSTASDDFPTLNCCQAARRGEEDAIVSCLDSSGSALDYSTYLGGSGYDGGSAAFASADGGVYITGPTASGDFPTVDPYQASYGGGELDAFVARLSSSGSSLVYATYLGGGDLDGGFAMTLDSASRIFLAGYTASPDFPVVSPCQPSYGGGDWDGFVSLLSPSGAALLRSTYLGGSGSEHGMGVALAGDGSVALAGLTTSSDFPTLNSYQGSYGGGSWDAFAVLYAPSLSSRLFSTYLGGSGLDQGTQIALDSSGRFWVAGDTASGDFPTVAAYQASYGGGERDCFVSALGFTAPTPPPLVYPVADDYTGDGLSEAAIFRPDDGLWAVRGLGRTRFGAQSDLPVAGDFGGGGVAEAAVYRPRNGLWAVKDCTRVYFGEEGDIPLRGDLDGDGLSDAAVFRPAEGLWVVRGHTRFRFGAAGDVPLVSDFSGDGLSDAAVFRPAEGLWAVRDFTRFYLGASGDLPVPAAFGWYVPYRQGGPFRAQAAVFRPATGLWAVRHLTRFYLGTEGDLPQAEDFSGNALADPAVFRPGNGLWAVRGLTRLFFGVR